MRVLSFFILIGLFSCQESKPYYPPQHPSLSHGLFDKYVGKLDTAYMLKDYFAVGIQLANLKAPADKIFHFIELGLKENEENCQLIYMWYSMYDQFRNNLVQSDTLQFLESHKWCLEKLGAESFQNFQEEANAKSELVRTQIIGPDSASSNSELIDALQAIYEDDQKVRLNMDLRHESSETPDHILNNMRVTDSINLIKIEEILSIYGHPTVQEVGSKLFRVPWLVLHHQSDIATRIKFDSILREAVGDEMMKGYRMRTQELKLSQEN